jgi:hypothetical protein
MESGVPRDLLHAEEINRILVNAYDHDIYIIHMYAHVIIMIINRDES